MLGNPDSVGVDGPPDQTPGSENIEQLKIRIRACRLCEAHLPRGPRPVVRFSGHSRILIVGQAPGTRVHETGIPWNDPSGDRLRSWLGVNRDQFYDEDLFAIVPMGFCYPGRAPGKGGDLPPRPECAPTWMDRVVAVLPKIELTVLCGSYAHSWFLGIRRGTKLGDTVARWKDHLPGFVVTPHPSPRNYNWLKKNPSFENEVVPWLQSRITEIMDSAHGGS